MAYYVDPIEAGMDELIFNDSSSEEDDRNDETHKVENFGMFYVYLTVFYGRFRFDFI